MRREPSPLGPRDLDLATVGDDAPGPRAEAVEAALESLGELGLGADDAILSVRRGRKLVLGHGDDLAEVAHVDPVRDRTLGPDPVAPHVDSSLHWLMAEAFPRDHVFLQVPLTPDQADRIAEAARDHGVEVADEIERGRDDIEARLNVLRAMKDHDLVVTPATGMLLRGERTDEVLDRAEALLEDDR